MKLRTNLILISAISLIFSACSQGEQQTNTQNAQLQPNFSATVAPTLSAENNKNSADNANAPVKSANQIVKASPTASPTPKATTSPVNSPNDNSAAKTKYKNYTVRGVVKKIDAANNSIVIDHEDIGDYMVAMEMPFPVVDKKILNGIKVGDRVTFVLETGVGVERIISIRKN